MKNFALHAVLLTSLLKGKLVDRGNRRRFKYVDFEWGDEHTIFEKLKCLFLKNVCLAHPDFNQDFILHTDASFQGLGSVLSQESSDQ